MFIKKFKFLIFFAFCTFKINAQVFFPADPYYTLIFENKQYNKDLESSSLFFRPYFFNDENSDKISFRFLSEFYLNNNSPNQENMDVRYFSKGYSGFNSFQFSARTKYLNLIIEPYLKFDNFTKTVNISRPVPFNVLNDYEIDYKINDNNLRNFLVFLNFRGIGIGYHKGNRWWGPGIHSTLQMTNNTWPFGSKIIGTMNEIKYRNLGFSVLYSIGELNKNNDKNLKSYHSAINMQINWYGPVTISTGISRNFLSGGILSSGGRVWTEKDASMLVFEGFLTSNLINKEYTVGGHDKWDQTLSGYLSISLPDRNFKIYGEFGFNDNRMYLADLISQPDHSMATIIGFRDYGFGKHNNLIYGFEWTNMLLTYTIRFRGAGGTPSWYDKKWFQFSSYKSRRWGAHSGSDSDDWTLYFGYLSDKMMILPSVNYERHGVVSRRPAEVKIEMKLDARYKYKDTWFGLKYERQREFFLGFPDYFYEDKFGNPIDSSVGVLANSRYTNTLILSINKYINF